MDAHLSDLIDVSTEVGADPELVQGGGGNTSTKTPDGRMYVKASGTALEAMEEESGYRCVDLEKCLALLEDPDLEGMPEDERERAMGRRLGDCCVDDLEGRPSVETLLHAQLGKCVVHTHPSFLNGLLSAQGGEAVIRELYADLEPPTLYIEYTDFGYPLAVRMKEEIEAYSQQHDRLPEVMFLENHGVFVSAPDADEAVEKTREVVQRARDTWRERKPENERKPFTPDQETEQELINEVSAVMRRTYSDILGRPVLVRFSLGTSTHRFFGHPGCKELAESGPLVPDQVVYCNGSPIWVDNPDGGELDERVERLIREQEDGVNTPACVLVDGLGLFVVGLSPELVDSAAGTMEAVLDMLVVADAAGGPRPLPDGAVERIRRSEAESYRTGLAAGRENSHELAGQVAVVTGAGSGLGRGISIGLAKRGMHVVLADIDVDGAEETKRRIREEEDAPGSGWPTRADVTDEDAVRNTYEYVIRNLGGVDVLVNCAGIAPPHPLVDFPVEDFRMALEVNLTGYFLMARECARLMRRQGTGGSIINLSSKSGLDASSKHSAYNATKAGEIHLARGWAQELAEYGIRVNSICPGNVFRESSIWNEDYIEALAEKRGLEPDEVIPYYINLTALQEEIDWEDIADAVAFLSGPHSSKITGQTLVVDAGQVFVR
ncbi:MAG: SDR family oxidoreductase [Candidatus Brocadiia bacterium]